MEFEDPIYGDQKVEKEVLKELIKSEPVQRLKNIHQAGPSPFFMDKPPVTRFEHSLGVMFLLRKFDASLEEQIAGLLHDIPHTAFSHVADFVFRTEDHEYHEEFMEEIVHDSEIPEILEKHGVDIDEVLDESNFKLLERDMPDLCADRIDYFLRDYTQHTGEDISNLLNGLTVVDNRFVVEDAEIAEEYALKYIEADELWWANPYEVVLYEVFAEIIRRAMDIDILEEEDLFSTDQKVMDRLRESEDEVIQEKLQLLDEGMDIERNSEDFDYRAETKARYVDPYIDTDEGLKQVSEFSEKVSEKIKEHREEVEGGYRVKIKS